MTEDTTGQQQTMDPVLHSSSSPTPAASSAGASSPAIPTNMTSVDWCGLGKSWKGGSLSRSGPQPPWMSATSASTGGGPTPGLTQPICRPWDRGDLLKRLSTFKAEIWQGSPKVCGPLACARRGWVSVSDDTITCEACLAQLVIPLSSWMQRQDLEEAATYAEKLDTGHKVYCPWRGNACTEGLAQLLPSPLSALIGGFDDRCDALLQFSSLPVISSYAIDEMKYTRGPEIDRLLAKPVRGSVKRIDDGSNTKYESIDAADSPYFQALKLISLCGWEPRFLPHVVDFEEHSAYSSRKDKAVGNSEGPSHRPRERGLLLPSRTCRPEKRGTNQNMVAPTELSCNPASAVLDCNLCGATVSLNSYITASRPMALTSSGLINITESSIRYTGALKRNASAASGVQGFRLKEAPPKETREEAMDAGMLREERMSSYSGALDMNLATAGSGTPATHIGSCTAEHGMGSHQYIVQAEGSEMGGPAASYESFGPGFRGHRMDEGGSTVDRSQSRLHPADSIEGTVLDLEGDEADDGEVDRRRSYGETSKRRVGESSGANQAAAIADHVPTEVDDTEHLRRSRREAILQELNKARVLPVQPTNNSLYASSVIAVDTSQNKQENSMESVENFPQDDDTQGTAFSWERSERVQNDDLNYIDQAQQSACHHNNAGPSDIGVSTGDEGDVDTGHDNEAGIGTANVLSVGMSGGSVQMGASHEAEIHGADMSVHKMESLVDDAELVTEVTDLQRQTSDSVLNEHFLPDDRKLTSVHDNDNFVDSVEVAPSFSVAKAVKHDDSGQEESWEGKQKDSLGDKLTDTNHVVNSNSVQASSCKLEKTGADAVLSNGKGQPNSRRRSREQGDEFDPIHQHLFYCPWINRHVAGATGGMETHDKIVLCGWQLTADALDAMHSRNNAFAVPMESESAASMHKGNRMAVSDFNCKQSSSKRTMY